MRRKPSADYITGRLPLLLRVRVGLGHDVEPLLGFGALLVTDVVTQVSLLLVAGPEELLSKIDYPEREDGIWELENVVSRKKQLLPYFTHLLRQLS